MEGLSELYILYSEVAASSVPGARLAAGAGTDSQPADGRGEALPVLLQNLVGRGQPSAGVPLGSGTGWDVGGQQPDLSWGLQPSQGTALWAKPHQRFLGVCHNEGSGWGWERALHT